MGTPGLEPVLLQTQYRMAPAIARWPCSYYYNGLVNDGPQERTPVKGFPSVSGKASGQIVFVDVYNSWEWSAPGEVSNQNEAEMAHGILEKLFVHNPDISERDVCVITPYAGQKRELQKILTRKVEVDTVDAFQGRECEIVILSTVRCGGTIGFLDDYRRTNVSLTRAKRALIVLGSAATLYHYDRYAGWGVFLHHLSHRGALIGGYLHDWKYPRYYPSELPSTRTLDWQPPAKRPKKEEKPALRWSSIAPLSCTPISVEDQGEFLLAAQDVVQKLATNKCFILSLGFLMDLKSGWSGGSSHYPEDPVAWTLKQWSHYGELAHVGVSKDPGNWVYYAMFLCFQGCSGP